MNNDNQNQQTPVPLPPDNPVVQENYTAVWKIILLIVFLPPIAWFLLYKQKHYHSWFSYLLVLRAIPELIFSTAFAFIIIPKLTPFLEQFGTKNNPTFLIYITLALLSLLAVLEIIFAVIIFKQYHQTNTVSKKLRLFAIALLFIDLLAYFFISPATVQSALEPIYSLSSKIQQTNTLTPKSNSNLISPIPVKGQGEKSELTHNLINNTPTIFSDNHFTFSFEYPKVWKAESKKDNPKVLTLTDENGFTYITIDSEISPSAIGISYCIGFPQDKRCEQLEKTDGTFVTIDWGDKDGATSSFISQKNPLAVKFTLHRVNDQTKVIFKKIITSFKFI
jgi:hypothetical protein